MLDKVSEVSGLKFEYVFAATYLEMIQAVQNGEADVLGFFPETGKRPKQIR